MPIFKAEGRLIFYAHVPKCGGVAVSRYLETRFGAVAFNDTQHMKLAPEARWTRTSPQHVDAASLARLFPPGFFDAVFTIVRHPVQRLVSAYHFQQDVEQSVSRRVGFSDWLETVIERAAADRFQFDNHVRPMAEIVPEGAQVFHMEHGLDALIPWLDRLTGRADGPRAIPRANARGEFAGGGAAAQPTAQDLARIAEVYAVDFDRFGYRPETRAPGAPAPVLDPDFAAARDRARRRMEHPLAKLARRLIG